MDFKALNSLASNINSARKLATIFLKQYVLFKDVLKTNNRKKNSQVFRKNYYVVSKGYIYEKSHKLGRLNHTRRDEQTCLDEKYLNDIKKRYKHSFIEMKAGDALIFDCNLLHSSSENISDKHRWGFIASYNKNSNCPSDNKRDYGNFEELIEVPKGRFMKYIS